MQLSRIHTLLFSLAVIGCFCAGFAVSTKVYGLNYSNAINDSSWKAESSVFSCQLVHQVPYYGEAVFRTRAGEASAFYLRAKTSRFQAGNALVHARKPLWTHGGEKADLGSVPIKRGTRPLWLTTLMTEKMLARLNEGYEIEISNDAWFEESAENKAKLAISNIGFRSAYKRYLSCLSGLLPSNFDQLKRTSLIFPAGETDELPASITRQLDRILALVKHDEKLRVFYIDGHTDSEGDRDENLELSKQRAELVSQYLVRRGIPETWITLRWHGERYPVASNATASGRERNRRVTVRLERVEEIEVLPLNDQEVAAAQ